MAYKLMYIPNDNTQNNPITINLDTQLHEPTNQIQLVSKDFKLTNKKTLS